MTRPVPASTQVWRTPLALRDREGGAAGAGKPGGREMRRVVAVPSGRTMGSSKRVLGGGEGEGRAGREGGEESV